jgi:glycosyltransferase involved in cell wall biosynthesis
MTVSFIFPVYNEEGNIAPLLDRLYVVLREQGYEYEIIAVNDGSRDQSIEVLKTFALKDPNFKIIDLRVNAGQTAALRAGIESATKDHIVTIDSDLENFPEDIPMLLEKIVEGHDVVSGWRQNRWQGQVTRRLPSTFANSIISKVTGVSLHDYGCTLKAYRREIIQGLPLYGEMHRFIPAYAARRGAKVTEVLVRYEPRRFGKSNYGLSRTFRVLLDLLLLWFLDRYMNRPIHFFGGLGFILSFLGFLTGFVAVILRVFWGLHLVQTPLPILATLLLVMGVNLIMMGVVAEVLMRTYYESNGQKTYLIRERINH